MEKINLSKKMDFDPDAGRKFIRNVGHKPNLEYASLDLIETAVHQKMKAVNTYRTFPYP
jgi:hypothetical protein